MKVTYHWQAWPLFFRKPHDCPECKNRMETFWDEESYAPGQPDPWLKGRGREWLAGEQIHYIKRLQCPACGKVVSAPQMKILENGGRAAETGKMYRLLVCDGKALLLRAIVLLILLALAGLIWPEKLLRAGALLGGMFFLSLFRKLCLYLDERSEPRTRTIEIRALQPHRVMRMGCELQCEYVCARGQWRRYIICEDIPHENWQAGQSRVIRYLPLTRCIVGLQEK